MGLIAERLKATVVSVGHRPELEAFLSRKIVLERRRRGAKLISDIVLAGAPRRKRGLKLWGKRSRAGN